MEKQLKIRNVIKETQDAITVVFEKDEHINQYESGQFINVFHTIGNEKISRSYSFSSAPLIDDQPSITIKKIPGGRLSNYLVDNLKKSQEIEVSQPLGRFGLSQSLEKNGHLVFIAGGSGITPLISMIKTALNTADDLGITLLYGNKNSDSIIFLDQLNELQAYAEGRFRVIHFLDEHVDTDSIQAVKGHITKEFLSSLPQEVGQITGYYICGPIGMMQSVKSYLETLGVEHNLIHVESFGSHISQTATKTHETARVTFIRQEGSVHVDMPRDQFILEAAQQNGLSLPHSCKEAMCGTCMVKVLSGRVEMQENYALTDAQIKEGYTLLCSGLPTTDEVILSYL